MVGRVSLSEDVISISGCIWCITIPGPMYITIVYLSHSWIWWANIPYLYHIHTIVIPCNSIYHIIIHMMYLVGGFNPSEKYESQLG
jgi:hypothetical protein